ncbi:MAG TPA: hypothetical protein VMF33_03385 [Acidimicrobiales bacterium]|nr:hypothetical protein [Acidimicrobiales bacterium]
MITKTDRQKGASFVAYGQICFLVFIAVCIAIRPGFVLKRNEGGISNYGPHIQTAFAYTVALLGLAEFSRRAGTFFRSAVEPNVQRLRRVLYFYCFIVTTMLITSYIYTINDTLRDIHFAFGIVLVLFEVGASWWMFQLFRRFVWDGVFLLVQLSGSIVSLVTIVGAIHLLFVGEMVTWIGFCGLIVHTSRYLATKVDAGDLSRERGLRNSLS